MVPFLLEDTIYKQIQWYIGGGFGSVFIFIKSNGYAFSLITAFKSPFPTLSDILGRLQGFQWLQVLKTHSSHIQFESLIFSPVPSPPPPFDSGVSQ